MAKSLAELKQELQDAFSAATQGVAAGATALLQGRVDRSINRSVAGGTTPEAALTRMTDALQALTDFLRDKGGSAAQQAFQRSQLLPAFGQKLLVGQDAGQALLETTRGGRSLDQDFRKTKQGGAGDETFADKLKGVASASTTAFATLAGGLGGLTRAASPALFNTLTQSMQLLAATVGQSLVGPVLDLSFKLQDAAHWVQNLDPAIKANIAAWAPWGAVVFGGVFILSKLGQTITGLLPLFGALKMATTFTFTSPSFFLLAGGLAAAAAAMGVFGQMSDKSRAGFGAIAGGALAAAAGVKILGLAFLTTPFGLVVMGLAAIGGALLAVRSAARDAQATMQAYNATVDAFAAIGAKAKGGGDVTHQDLLKLMDVDEQAEYAKLDEKGKRKFLKEKAEAAHQELDVLKVGGYTPEYNERVDAAARAALQATRDQTKINKEATNQPLSDIAGSFTGESGPAQRNREAMLRDAYLKIGLSPEKAKAEAAAIIKALGSKANADVLAPEDIAAASNPKSAILEKHGAREAAFGAAAAMPVLPEALQLKMDELRKAQAFQARHAIAFQHEMSASSMDVGSVRGTIQNLGLNINPLEAQSLELQREAGQMMREYLAKTQQGLDAIEKIAKKL